ncbi:hypothetical protein B7R22_07775 [Subtercola boreus]|uniref:RNA polymerase subunit sigma-24 n=1 Tax=Subtercola boreus TaxID=120213 RepID=A0A3E0VZE0_9MICO|nr:RNA polymerase sigma factor [Subtercola boreus]RFA14975.1 hypothetical protein B7R22_07775 [Subtercola boreus]
MLDRDMTDRDVLARLARRDEAAMGMVFDRYAASVTRYAWALAATPSDAEEIVQDTFVTVWQKAAVIVLPEASLLPWLLVTARNHALNARRRHFRNSADELPAELAAVDSHDEARDRLAWVRNEIERLQPLDRRVCELCLIEGWSYADAAEHLGVSVGAVRQRVARARARLRKAVTENEK